jgi:phospholipase/carboxylesterase
MKFIPACAAAVLFWSAAAVAAPRAPVLDARPSAAASGLPAGETRLANGAVAYRPARTPAGPLPLIVLLHGAGHRPPNFLQAMEPTADKRGVILLAPSSLGMTWDWVENSRAGDNSWSGPDAHRIDQALKDLFTRAAVDPSRVVLLGFSDGASYALSLGLSNPKLFTSVISLSPGMFDQPRRIDRAQRVFIAHGRQDRILPFAATSAIADTLRGYHANLRFHAFDGDHEINHGALVEALDWTLSAPQARASLQQ